jgi:hypothetical protein
MDARDYFHLSDAIAAASSAAELSVTRETIASTTMHPIERRALERAIAAREQALTADVPVPRPPVIRAD